MGTMDDHPKYRTLLTQVEKRGEAAPSPRLPCREELLHRSSNGQICEWENTMEKIEIQKQQVIGWAVVIRKDGDVSYKCLEPIVLSVDGVGECCIEEKNDRAEGDIAGILPAAA